MTDLTTPPTRPQEGRPRRGDVATYLLVQAESQVDLAGLVADVNGLPEVISAMQVVGPYDVIAQAGGRSEETRASLTAAVAGIPGVMRVVAMPTGSEAGRTDDTPWAA